VSALALFHISEIYMLAILLSAPGLATTVSKTVEFPVNQTAPSTSIPSAQPVVWDVVYGYNPELPNTTVPSSWAYLTCMIEDGFILARFEATRGTWPSSFPGSATCSATFNSTDTITTTLTITTSTASRRDFDFSATTPTCSTPWTITAPIGWTTDGCKLPAAPSGKVYAVPKWAEKSPITGLMTWSAQHKVGASAAPDTDPEVPGVYCAIAGYDLATDEFYYFVDVDDVLKTDTTVYCPIRHQTVASSAFSWGTEATIIIDRP
jgi:hypothetical protein